MKVILYFLKNKAFTSLLLVLIVVGGIFSYMKMGKLEDAPFTIKQALVLTPYPGATAEEVQSQVTDIIEEAIQSLGELYYIKTENRSGLSKITVYMKKEIRANEMQQLWDKLRRKVSDVQSKLPPGAGPSLVNDDFGDVLGVFYGLSSDTHSYRELEEQAKELKKLLLNVKDVAKVEVTGIQSPTIEVKVKPAVLAQSGLTVQDIAYAFDKQNKVVDAGAMETDEMRIRIEPSGSFGTLDEIRNLMIVSRNGAYFRLSDVAGVSESYLKPSRSLMRMNGSPAVGIAVSTVPTGNVVDMARLVKDVVTTFGDALPEGYLIENIYDQGHESAVANDGFILNLVISVMTVVAILLFFIGFKNGILVGSGLIFSILGTLMYMFANGIALQRMSLAAIIIAMGMLVDNAIVVTDSALINMQKGMRKRVAILKAASTTAIPLLAATAIAVLTFWPVYMSPHVSGELLSSLFIVLAVSLFLSWVFALIQTPYCIELFVRRPKSDEVNNDMFKGKYYNHFRNALRWVIRHKTFTVAGCVLLLVVSLFSFKFIPKVFLPQLDKQYFTIDLRMAEGTKIEQMDKVSLEISEFIESYKNTEAVSAYVGQTPPRYYLANSNFGPQSNFAQLIIKCNTPAEARDLQKLLKKDLPDAFPEVFVMVNKFELSSAKEAKIEARFLGPDANVLDSLTQLALNVMRKNPKVADARNEWDSRTLAIEPVYDPLKSGRAHLTKANMMESVKSMSDGLPIGIYRDNEKKVPVVLTTETNMDNGLEGLANQYVWNGTNSAPLSQITQDVRVKWTYPTVRTYDRQLSMAAMCNPVDGVTMSELHKEIRDEIEAIQLPEGYRFFWDSEYKDQGEAMQALVKYFPLAFLLLILILVALFRNFKQPIIILLILPLSLIGVAVGMLLTGFDFGFFCIAGWLGLLGMIIKNVIVLLDEMNILKRQGYSRYDAIVEATVSRVRPVLMAAITTIFGMIPLLFDIVFGGMAATIVFGLTFATLLTLFVTPALCGIFYKIKA